VKITRRTRYHDACIEDIGQLRVLRFERNRQSSMFLDAPFDTDFDYPGYLHLTLAVRPEATRTLVIGLGGSSIVKRMWRDYPEMSLDVVELDPDVIDICRTYFALPDDARIRAHLGDGREFVEEDDATYDIVIVDAFDDDVVPKLLTTEEFMRTARERLAPDGVIAFNTIGWLHRRARRSLEHPERDARR
jgi:spermidine synthase